MNKSTLLATRLIASGFALIAALTLFSALAAVDAHKSAPQDATNGNVPPRLAARQPLTATQYFQDVAPGSFFYTTTASLYLDGAISGYPCGQAPAGVCVPPNNLPYYLASNNVSRGQMSIYVQNARTKPGIRITTNSNQLPVAVIDDATGAASFYGVVSNVGIGRDTSLLSTGLAGFASAEDPISNTANAVGLVAESLHDNGAWFASYDTSPYRYASVYVVNNGNGVVIGDQNSISNTLTVHGPLVVDGPKTGYIVDIMQNTGATDIHPGDVVVAGRAAAGAAVVGDIPVAAAAAGFKDYDTGVLGVADLRWIPADPQAPIGSQARGGYYTAADTIQPGEYMGVVTLGAYKRVKVDATTSPIHVGDLLTTSSFAGAAMRADEAKVKLGSVVGKALGDLEGGRGYIPVFVTLK